MAEVGEIEEKQGKQPSRHWRRHTYRWLPVLAWMGFIFYLSAQPSLPAVPEATLQTLFSYGAHFAEYGILAALLFRAQGSVPKRRAILVSLIIAGLYALSDEYHQSFVPNRSADVTDLLADLAGAGATLSWLWRLRQ